MGGEAAREEVSEPLAPAILHLRMIPSFASIPQVPSLLGTPSLESSKRTASKLGTTRVHRRDQPVSPEVTLAHLQLQEAGIP